MDKKIFVSILKQLSDNYGKEFTREQLVTWYTHLGQYEPELLYKAISRIISTKDFMPTISVIKREIATLENPVLELDVDEQWAIVMRNIGSIGRYRREEYFNSLNPFTAEIVRKIGLDRICDSTDEQLKWVRKQFVDIFNSKQNNFSDLHSTNNECLTFQEIKRIAEKNGYNMELLDKKDDDNLLGDGNE